MFFVAQNYLQKCQQKLRSPLLSRSFSLLHHSEPSRGSVVSQKALEFSPATFSKIRVEFYVCLRVVRRVTMACQNTPCIGRPPNVTIPMSDAKVVAPGQA